MLQIKSTSGKPCTYCQSDKQVVEVLFDDQSFCGAVCFKDLWKMIECRSKSAARLKEKQKDTNKPILTPESSNKES